MNRILQKETMSGHESVIASNAPTGTALSHAHAYVVRRGIKGARVNGDQSAATVSWSGRRVQFILLRDVGASRRKRR